MLRRLLQPITALRGRLQQIRYYSANRHRSAWDTAVDAALVITLLLAAAAVPAAQSWIEWESSAFDLSGAVYERGGEHFSAHIRLPDRPQASADGARLVGTFEFQAEVLSGGWPFASKSITHLPDVTFQTAAHGRALEVDDSLEEDTRIRAAIEYDMASAGLEDAREHWGRTEDLVQYRPLAWMANGITWWLILLMASVLLIRFLQLTVALYWMGQGYRWRERSRQGRCVHCGYNMYGLEFNDRCPECGELVE